MTGRRQGPAGRRVSARVRRRRAAAALAALAVLAVLGVSLAAWIVGRPDSVAGTSKRALSPAHAVAAPRGLPAAEAGLMPWHLAAPVSREVVVAGPRGKLIVLGGLTDGGVSADGVSALGTAHGGASRIGMLNAPLHDAAAALIGRRVLVFGGGSSATVPTVQAFTLPGRHAPAVTAITAGSMPAPRSDAAAVTVGPTTYIVGGYDGTHPDAPVLATTNGRTFTTVVALRIPVRYPAVAALGGRIFVFGGQAISGPQAAHPLTPSRWSTQPGTRRPSSAISPSPWRARRR